MLWSSRPAAKTVGRSAVGWWWLIGLLACRAAVADSFDVVVYGGTSGGVTAAVEAARLGRRVAVVEPSAHLGGISANGLGYTDVGNPRTIGGLSREFYHRVWLAYRADDAWKFQPRGQFTKASGQGVPTVDDAAEVQWNFEPHVAEKVFDSLIADAKIKVIRGRLKRPGGIEYRDGRITAVDLEDGTSIQGTVFIDAGYEGDLMAAAGVSYVVGRESNAQYGESLNGIQTARSKKNQLPGGIDPFVKIGDAASGLIPGVNAAPGGDDGIGDRRVQAYCFRVCLTNAADNRLPVPKPAGYDERDYELLFRAIEAHQTDKFFTLDRLVPNRKTDSNNGSGLSLDWIGGADRYPDADYTARDRITAAHREWDQGLIWTVQNHPRVPEKICRATSAWGLPKDEFTDNDHWPRQLYVREGRRMIGSLVETESSLTNDSAVTDAIGRGSYAMDSHNTQRYVDSTGHVRNEGDVQVAVHRPYRISYRAIVPKKGECRNLIVPWCLSATHIAYGSIRMEPVFMIVGQSAGAAAAIAVTDRVAVQDVSYEKLSKQLRADGQILD